MRITVDASVAVKWFVAEDYREEARILLGPGISLYAPDLLLAESANAIWKKARRGEIGSAQPFVEGIITLPQVVHFQSSELLLRDATSIALRTGHPVYDSLYIACARLTNSALVTADRTLARIVSDRVPHLDAITLDDPTAIARLEETAFGGTA